MASEAVRDKCHAASRARLRELLRGNHRSVFRLIHKFQSEKVWTKTLSPGPLWREFFGHERIVNTLYGAVKPDPVALKFAGLSLVWPPSVIQSVASSIPAPRTYLR